MRRETIAVTLTILLLSLVVGNLFKYQIITKSILTDNVGLVSVLKDIITIAAIVFGAFLSYFRFFIGRTFSAKADVEFDVVMIETPHKSIMHTITVSIVNKGNLSIWDPTAKIGIREFNLEKRKEELIIEKFNEKSYFGENKKRNMVIDAGEKAYFMIWREFEYSTWAVTYTAEVTSNSGRIWKKAITVANMIKKEQN